MTDIVRDAMSWPSVERAVLERIHAVHLDLEGAPADKVPRLQGEIAGLRWLLSAAEPPPPVPTENHLE